MANFILKSTAPHVNYSQVFASALATKVDFVLCMMVCCCVYESKLAKTIFSMRTFFFEGTIMAEKNEVKFVENGHTKIILDLFSHQWPGSLLKVFENVM